MVDGRALIVSDSFEGKNLVSRHRLVYDVRSLAAHYTTAAANERADGYMWLRACRHSVRR